MQLNQYISNKKPIYQGLRFLDTYITDESEFSEDYFLVTSLPDELTAGINSFKISGNTNNLVTNTNVDIEILDRNNNPIFHSVSDYVDRAGRRLISIHIYDDIPIGVGTITLVGESKNVPAEWVNKNNTKWVKKILIDSYKRNKNEILFNITPDIIVKNTTKKKNNANESSFNNIGIYSSSIYSSSPGAGPITINSQVKYRYLYDSRYAANYDQYESNYSDNLYLTSSYQDQKNLQVFKSYYYNKFNINHDSVYNQDIYAPAGYTVEELDSSAVATIKNTSGETLENIISKDLINGTITIPSPTGSLPYFNDITASFSAKIIDILKLENLTAVVLLDTPYSVTSSNQDHLYKSFDYSEYSMHWIRQPDDYASENGSGSFLNIEFNNLTPLCGDIYRIKTFLKSKTYLDEFRLLNDSIVKPVNLLVSESNKLNYEIGDFSNYASSTALKIDWESEAINTSEISDVSLSNSKLMNSMRISTVNPANGYFKIYPFMSCSFKEFNDYILNLNLVGDDAYDEDAIRIKFYMSGSAFSADIGDELLGKFICDIDSDSNLQRYQNLSINFVADNDGYGQPIFKIYEGAWYMSDINIYPRYQTGFTPNYFRLNLPVSPHISDDVIDLKFEFYDYQNTMATQMAEVNDIQLQTQACEYCTSASYSQYSLSSSYAISSSYSTSSSYAISASWAPTDPETNDLTFAELYYHGDACTGLDPKVLTLTDCDTPVQFNDFSSGELVGDITLMEGNKSEYFKGYSVGSSGYFKNDIHISRRYPSGSAATDEELAIAPAPIHTALYVNDVIVDKASIVNIQGSGSSILTDPLTSILKVDVGEEVVLKWSTPLVEGQESDVNIYSINWNVVKVRTTC